MSGGSLALKWDAGVGIGPFASRAEVAGKEGDGRRSYSSTCCSSNERTRTSLSVANDVFVTDVPQYHIGHWTMDTGHWTARCGLNFFLCTIALEAVTCRSCRSSGGLASLTSLN